MSDAFSSDYTRKNYEKDNDNPIRQEETASDLPNTQTLWKNEMLPPRSFVLRVTIKAPTHTITNTCTNYTHQIKRRNIHAYDRIHW